MADEPRRSGRATKGQHTKNQETAASPEPKPTKGKGKASKKNAVAESADTEDDGEDENALIRCVCGVEEDDGGRMMICCDNCSAWQHNDCMGITEDENKLPDNYLCEQCAPEQHKDLLAAMARGEKPWEDKKKGKKGKGAKKGKGKQAKGVVDTKTETTEEAGASPAAEPTPAAGGSKESGKRKREAVEDEPQDEKPRASRRVSSQVVKEEGTVNKKRKASLPAKPSKDPNAPVDDISELTDGTRKSAATELKKRLTTQIEALSGKGTYDIPKDDSADSLADRYGILIEHALFTNQAGNPPDFSGAYRQQLLQIIFNVAKNATLLQRLLEGSLSPDELSTMSSDEMASEELQQKMAEMKKEADKQSILVQDEGPRIRRTHKGEELIDDQNEQITSESLTSAVPMRHRDSIMSDGGDDKDNQTAMSPTANGAGGFAVPPTPALDRRSSSNFDIQNVWSNVQSSGNDNSRRTSQPTASRTAPAAPRGESDADIDRLLEDDDNDSEPYSPSEFHQANSTKAIWTGRVDMPNSSGSVAAFDATAHHVAGADLAGRVPSLSSIFPATMTLCGRIESKRADSYLCSLSAARSTDVSVASVEPVSRGHGQAEFDKLFTYLSDRGRFGVLDEKQSRDNVRDSYFIPLEAGAADMPEFLQRLEYNAIEQPRPQRMLLIVFVLKWKSPPSSAQGTPTHAANAVATATSAMSPIVANVGNTRSPSFGQAAAAQQGRSSLSNQLPANPYAPPDPDRARNILGPYYDSPVAREITSQSVDMPAELLQNLRRVFDEHPEAQNNMAAFTAALNSQGK